MLLVRNILSSLVSIASCIFIGASFYSMWKVRGLFADSTSAGCLDTPTTSLLSDYSSELLTLLWMDAVVFVWSVLSVLVAIYQMIAYPHEKRNRIKELAKNPTEIELLNPKKDSIEPEDRFLALAPNGFASSFNYGNGSGDATQLAPRKSLDSNAALDDQGSSFETRRSTSSFGRLQPF